MNTIFKHTNNKVLDILDFYLTDLNANIKALKVIVESNDDSK